jgi:hypothetical protein
VRLGVELGLVPRLRQRRVELGQQHQPVAVVEQLQLHLVQAQGHVRADDHPLLEPLLELPDRPPLLIL